MYHEKERRLSFTTYISKKIQNLNILFCKIHITKTNKENKLIKVSKTKCIVAKLAKVKNNNRVPDFYVKINQSENKYIYLWQEQIKLRKKVGLFVIFEFRSTFQVTSEMFIKFIL